MDTNDKSKDKDVDRKNCEYARIFSGISICSWNNMVCRSVPENLCAIKSDTTIEEEKTK